MVRVRDRLEHLRKIVRVSREAAAAKPAPWPDDPAPEDSITRSARWTALIAEDDNSEEELNPREVESAVEDSAGVAGAQQYSVKEKRRSSGEAKQTKQTTSQATPPDEEDAEEVPQWIWDELTELNKAYADVTDASAVALAWVLMQDVRKGLQPIAFESKQFSSAEQNYHAGERRELSRRQARWYEDLVEVGAKKPAEVPKAEAEQSSQQQVMAQCLPQTQKLPLSETPPAQSPAAAAAQKQQCQPAAQRTQTAEQQPAAEQQQRRSSSQQQ
ncbi:hypothetical protein CYMTET_43958 [Cymbomonas tetramitiformis]|uniref:Reverse transcriptase/retrotransposon-derived protein RNase H-like domain-containing protein n=1 Tax=Cymbomonas tetramitiformis TaxID=36881 RepID=A0AAE0C327_9CHLO|nr:hypothetical protein CYMTET_43958 [Cymbomonas tetramitiformis]